MCQKKKNCYPDNVVGSRIVTACIQHNGTQTEAGTLSELRSCPLWHLKVDDQKYEAEEEEGSRTRWKKQCGECKSWTFALTTDLIVVVFVDLLVFYVTGQPEKAQILTSWNEAYHHLSPWVGCSLFYELIFLLCVCVRVQTRTVAQWSGLAQISLTRFWNRNMSWVFQYLFTFFQPLILILVFVSHTHTYQLKVLGGTSELRLPHNLARVLCSPKRNRCQKLISHHVWLCQTLPIKVFTHRL